MGSRVDWALRYAIHQAKKNGRAEVSADDLLLGCFRALAQFGIVQLGPWRFDLEELGIDWLALGMEKFQKVAYTDEVVEILDLASRIARVEGAESVAVEHTLAAFAGREDGLMGKLKQEHGIGSADWRAAISGLSQRPAESLQSVSRDGRGGPIAREYLTPEDAAEILGIHVQTVRAHVRSGKLPALRLAGERAIRIRRSDLEKVFEPVTQAN